MLNCLYHSIWFYVVIVQQLKYRNYKFESALVFCLCFPIQSFENTIFIQNCSFFFFCPYDIIMILIHHVLYMYHNHAIFWWFKKLFQGVVSRLIRLIIQYLQFKYLRMKSATWNKKNIFISFFFHFWRYCMEWILFTGI